jgi:hypothetical protein
VSNFIIKPSPARKIKYPTDDPSWQKKQKVAAKRIKEGKMKFASESEERDYLKRVSSNKMNVVGIPAWYPPETLTFSMSDIPDMTQEQYQKAEEEKIRIETIKDIDLHCVRCDKITSHSISPDQSFCHDCGKQRPDYSEQYENIIKPLLDAVKT